MRLNQKQSAIKGRYLFGMMAILLLFGVVFFHVHEAQALRISMKRIIFEGPKRSDVITIMNNTAQEQTYRLDWRHYRMDEDRSLVALDENDPAMSDIKWADKMIRYAPRRVTVPPGAAQQIRILLRRPRDLPAGEYRSHLWVITETEPEAFQRENDPMQQRSFRLAIQPSLTLPVFVRHGDLQAGAQITELQYEAVEGGGAVSFALNRTGNRSLYGDLNIICTVGGEYQAHSLRGIAVYTEVSKRNMDIEFTYPPERAGDCSQVRVEYVADRDDRQYGGQVMARASAARR